MVADGRWPKGLQPGLWVQRADERRERDVARHHAQHPGIDGAPVQGAKGGVPLVQTQRVDGGDQVLVAVVKALARPVFGSGGHAVALEHLDLFERMTGDGLHIAAKAARCDNRAAKGGVDVQYWRERPVDAAGAGFLGHDSADISGGLQVVHSSQTQRVGHLGAKGQAQVAAFQVGRDQWWHGTGCLQRGDVCQLRLRIGSEDGCDATGLKLLDAGEFGSPHPRTQHKELRQSFVGAQALKSGSHPRQ